MARITAEPPIHLGFGGEDLPLHQCEQTAFIQAGYFLWKQVSYHHMKTVILLKELNMNFYSQQKELS